MAEDAEERQVDELRERLYRPDPSPDAVDEYLSAAERSGAVPTGPADAAPAPRPRRRPRVAIGAVVVLVAVPALLVAARQTLASAPEATVPTGGASVSTIDGAGPGIPAIPDPAGFLIATATSAGPATRTFDARGDRALISVSCLGLGTASVRIDADPPLLLACDDDSPSGGILAGQGDLDRFTVSVTTTDRARWAYSVGAVDVDGTDRVTEPHSPTPTPSATR